MAEDKKEASEPKQSPEKETAKPVEAAAPDQAKSTPKPEIEDIVEDPEGPEESAVIAFSRTVGVLARKARRPLEMFSYVLFPRAKPAPERPDQVPELLKELGALVSSHSDKDYVGLQDVEEFWKLISRLAIAGRRKRVQHVGRGTPAARRRAKAAAAKSAVAVPKAEKEKPAAPEEKSAAPEKKPAEDEKKAEPDKATAEDKTEDKTEEK